MSVCKVNALQRLVDLEIQTNKQNMKEKLNSIMEFPTSTTRPLPQQADTEPAQNRTISLVYTLRGVVVDQHLTFFSEWENYTNPYKRKLSWFKSDFSNRSEICPVDESDVLTIARDRGSNGVLTVYVKDDVPEVLDKVLPPDYLRVISSCSLSDPKDFIQLDDELFQKELNPPVIEITQPVPDEAIMDTEEALAPSVSPHKDGVQRSLNPFLNMQEHAGPPDQAEQANEPQLAQTREDEEMAVDKDDRDNVVPLVSGDKNPFRGQVLEKEDSDRQVEQEKE